MPSLISKIKFSDLENYVRLGLFVINAVKAARAKNKLVVTGEDGVTPIPISEAEFNAKLDALHLQADAVAEGIDDRIEGRHPDGA